MSETASEQLQPTPTEFRTPEQYDKLAADPGLVGKLVPEIIRWQTPLS